MTSNSLFSTTNAISYFKLSLWIFILLTAVYFVIKDAFPYYTFDETYFGRYWDHRWVVIGHVSGGILALAIGPLQFWRQFRTKYMNTHRTLGKIYLLAILIGAISSVFLSFTVALAIHWTWALSLLGLASAWIVTAGMAYISIRRKRITEHQEWMIRSYVVTFAFVSFRFINDLPVVQNLGSFIETGPSTIWISWVFPLMIAEVVMSWNRP